MEQKNAENIANPKQTISEKIQNSVYSVQNLDVKNDDAFEINYSGTPMLTTKERYTELANKAIKFDNAKEAYFKMKQTKERYENAYNEAIEKHKAEMAKSKALEKQVAMMRDKYAELENALTVEQSISQQLGEKLAKFTNNHGNMPSKKTVFTEQEKGQILTMWIEGRKVDPKFNIKKLHDKVMLVGRQVGNRRVANVSYETVRATMAELRDQNPQYFK